MWDRRKIQAKRAYFRAQRLCPTGNFTEFVVRVYYAVLACSEKDGSGCPAARVPNRRLSHFVYRGIYDQPDHDYDMVIEDCKRNLFEMGYLRRSPDGGRIYVERPLDFLAEGDHERCLAMAGEFFCPAEPAAGETETAALSCPACGGAMVLRRGKYGPFFGCGQFPCCRETLSLAEGTYRLLQRRGMALYAVTRPCWKCGQILRVRSYFPYLDLMELLPEAGEALEGLRVIRLSVLPALDAHLMGCREGLEERYSKLAGYSYVGNICLRCDMLQGSRLTLGEVLERLEQAAAAGELDAYVETRVPLTEETLPLEEWTAAVEQLV